MELNEETKQITPFDEQQTSKLEFILDLMAFGYSKRSIIENYLKQFGGGRSSAYEHYKMAVWSMIQDFSKDKPYHVTSTINSVERTKKRAIQQGDYRTALAADKLKADLLQLAVTTNEPGKLNAADPGTADTLDAKSVGALAEAITRAQTAVDDGQHAPLGPEQLQDG